MSSTFFGTALRMLVVVLAALWSLGPAVANEDFKTVDGLAVYMGLIPAGMVAGHPSAHDESRMHGGVPTGRHQYHLVIALFDDATGARIENAEVSAVVSGLGDLGATNLRLEPMSIENTITYGDYVDLRGFERFNVTLTIEIPGRPPARVTFADEHVP